MGHWSQSARRGGCRHLGRLATLRTGDWTWEAIGGGKAEAARTALFPSGHVQWDIRYRIVGAATWLYWGATGLATIEVPGLTVGQTYECQACWCILDAPDSDWTPAKTALIS
jgi:hypothetical protein